MGVIEAPIEGRMTNGEAADARNLSKRQVQRIKKKVHRTVRVDSSTEIEDDPHHGSCPGRIT
jgi:hypothetical protein